MKPSEEAEAKIARYRSFLQYDPNNLALATDLIDLLCDAHLFDQALVCIEQLPEQLQTATVLRIKKAEILLGNRDFETARNYVKQLFSNDSSLLQNATLLHYFGLSQYFLGAYESALDSFSNATNSDATNSNNWKFLAYTCHQLNHLQEAINAAQQWVKIDPCADSYAYLAVLCFDNEEQELANTAALKALELNPLQSDALTIRGTLAIASNDLTLATTSIHQALSSNAKNGRAWLGQGLLLMSQGQLTKTISSLEEAHQLMPNHVGTLISLGWARVKCDDLQRAKLDFETAISLDRNFAESYGALACVFAMEGKVKDAEVNILLAKKLNPHNFSGNYARSLVLTHQGNEAEANALIEQLMHQTLPNSQLAFSDHLRSFLLTSQ